MSMRFLEKLLTFTFDIVAFNLALAASFWFRYKSGLFPETYDPSISFLSLLFPIAPMLLISGGWFLLFFLSGLYREWYKESRLDEFFVVTRTVLIGIALVFLITSADQIVAFFKSGDPGPLFTRTKFGVLATYGLCMLFFATTNRFAMHTTMASLFKRGLGVNRLLIIGANESAEKLVREMSHYPEMGNRVIGFIDDDGRKKATTCADLPVFGTYSDLPAIAKKEHVAGIIISHVSTSANEIMRVIEYTGDLSITIYMLPGLLDVISGHFKTHQIYGVPLMILLQDHMSPWKAQIKRSIDIVAALLVLSLGAPLWLFLAWLVRKTSPGPAFYKQERAGKFGRPFMLYKYRSMYVDAEKRSGPQWATRHDPRITPVGRFLRKTRLDEFPQFINVVRGEMSLVGPRPERPFFIEQLKKEIPWYVRRLKMKPGITGWAQVKHKYDESIEDVKQKVMYDLYYFENMSLILDLKIMLRTVLVVFTGKGAN
ncbi:MAG: exopolysaccharide biosynthesis polyprenyl glycosylphosphotransferase [Chitinivibrionales bacterium]|nr:exopolysaccharide biosynthesis polyprenyl glycosylphosphotransferase [Chitinivibrionales bacterium]